MLMLTTMTVMASCNGSEEDNSPKNVEFAATAATYSSGPQVSWNSGDKIGLVFRQIIFIDSGFRWFQGHFQR